MHHQDTPITHKGSELQTAHRDWLNSKQLSHFVTLNFHSPYSDSAARQCLRLWSMDVESRVFRTQRFKSLAPEDRFIFYCYPEFTLHYEPHFHLLCFVHEERRKHFDRTGARLWHRLVPSGTADLQRIQDSQADRETVIDYTTKIANRAASHDSFIVSTMLH